MALTGTARAAVALNKTNPIDLVTATSDLVLNWAATFADGVGLNQMNRLWSDSRSVAASGDDALDLAGGSLVDEFGTALTFARVKLLAVRNTSLVAVINVGHPVGNTVTTLFNAAAFIRPGGTLLIIAPDATGAAVTAGTGDIINIRNTDGANTATYDIVIGGGAT